MTTRVWVGLLLCGFLVLPGCGDDSAGDADVSPDDADVQEDVSGLDADADADPDFEDIDTVVDVDATDDGVADEVADEGPDDAGDAEVDPCPPPVCGDDELCGESGQGDGMDNDCDTEVDETCSCDEPGTTLECFPGDPSICTPGLPCIGACVRGYQTCGTDNRWGPCAGATVPAAEVCDGMDNDCDDVFDEGISGCVPPIRCPRSMLATPMSWVWLDGGSMFPDAYDSWNWTITCPPTVTSCPAPEEPTSRDTRVMLVSSGTYRARATVVAGTATHSCEFAIVARGAGLRVELDWDTMGTDHGDTDLDVHLHKWGAETDFGGADDCHWLNCKATSDSYGVRVDWGLAATTELTACRDAPHGEGAAWVALGSCYNPRLDVDIISCTNSITDPAEMNFCAPENINVDNPPLGQPFRIMVHYWSAYSYSGTTNATVNVFCGGAIRATLGPQPLTSPGEIGDRWLVADVIFYETACGPIECEVVPLSVVQTDATFGPTWSTFSAAP